MNYKFEFERTQWKEIAPGALEKSYYIENKQIRLVRFDDSFVEEDWCTIGHMGYVLNGEMQVEFENETTSYSKGDGLHLEMGIRHKAVIEKGKFVELILFEEKVP